MEKICNCKNIVMSHDAHTVNVYHSSRGTGLPEHILKNAALDTRNPSHLTQPLI